MNRMFGAAPDVLPRDLWEIYLLYRDGPPKSGAPESAPSLLFRCPSTIHQEERDSVSVLCFFGFPQAGVLTGDLGYGVIR